MMKKFILLLSLLAAGLLIVACAPAPQMPASAVESLTNSWQSIPGSATHELTILRAWPGEAPQESNPDMLLPEEVWCVETNLSSIEGNTTDPEAFIWIVTRTNPDAEWQAAPLMIMSSLWPYQACGEGE